MNSSRMRIASFVSASWALTSRAIADAPMIVPAASRTGEMVTEISITRPSLRRRLVK